MRSLCAVILGFTLFAPRMFAQSDPQNYSSTTDTAPARSESSTPVTMKECEGPDNCATWTFLGTQGNGQWPSGDTANLSVKVTDANKVIIERADSTGSSAGLTAVYRGTRVGNHLSGKFDSSWPGHWTNKSGAWSATIEKIPQSPPTVMRVCADPRDPNLCSTWTWANGHYDGWREWGVSATMTVESFTPTSVVIRRTDTGASVGGGGAGFTAVYRGTISGNGDSILDGVAVYSNGGAGQFKAYWGATLRDLPPPSSPMPHQQPVVVTTMPVVCFPWFFGVVCE